jgi:hypothetical protein
MIAHVIWSVGKRYGALKKVRTERDTMLYIAVYTYIFAFVCNVMSGIWPMTYAVLSVLSAPKTCAIMRVVTYKRRRSS